MVSNRLLRHISFILIIVAIMVTAPLVSEAQTEIQEPTSNEAVALTIPKIIDEKPLRIRIANIGINVNVEDSGIENGTWAVPEHAAGFAEGSAYLDEEHGNSVIFAHARWGLFKPLIDVKDGDTISVLGEKNMYTYKVTSIEKILPDEIDKIKSFGDHQLTLFTCEGINDEYRLLVKAKRIDTYSLSNSEVI